MELRTQEAILTDMKKAKMYDDTKRMNELITEMLMPEAIEIVNACKKNLTTKDGYGTLLKFTLQLPKSYRLNFIDACVSVGFPFDTAETVKQLV